MGTVGTIARRGFLIGSVAIAGGVAFGIHALRTPADNPLLDGLAEGETTFNPWVKIGKAGIVLIAPHTDLGQGVRSIQAAMIAEELDLNLGQFTVETGPPAAAYFNAALGSEGAPYLESDKSFAAEAARFTTTSLFKLIGMQITGGSSTVPDTFDRLRTAGAVARETLKLAASRRSGVPVAQLRTQAGEVLLPNGAAIRYTDLAAEAARLTPVQDVTLRDPSQWRLLGKEMQRIDIVGKSTGTLVFGIDLHMDGMVNAAVRFNPRQGGKLNRFTPGAAATMPGVKKIVPVTDGVAVVADNSWNAMQAVNAVQCDWGPAPYPADSKDHWAAIAASFVDDRLDKEWRSDGDVAGTIGANPRTMEYRAPYVAHAPLEPIGALIKVTEDRVDIWVSHQIPRIAQQMVAEITGVDIERVHLHNQYCGGSFGHRLEFQNVRYAAEIGKAMKGVPVKLTFSREEDFAHDFPRPPAIGRASGKVANARIEALDIAMAGPSVAESQFGRAGLPGGGADDQLAASIWNMPYAIPNLRVRAYRVPGLAPVSSWRSVGASINGFFLESAIDELILEAGADPLAERLRLCPDPVHRKVLEAVGEMSNWGTPLGPNRGRGVALAFSFNVPVAEVVEVTNTPAGIKIDKVYVAADVGRILDPVNFDNNVKGGVVWGLGHAINCEITYRDGMAEQTNFHMHTGMRMNQSPEIIVRGLENGARIRGIGEPSVPPAAPALANAIFAATGKRLREMPFAKTMRFV